MQIATQDGDTKALKCLKAVVGFTLGAYTLGRIPLGATVERVDVGVRTVFNGSGATIDVGYSGTVGAFMANASITEATAGIYTVMPNVALTADKTVIATVGGTVGTTGDATVLLWYSV